MGFGYGGSQAVSGVSRYNNSQTAHVWNAQTKESGQSNNGNFYFRGRAIYSYGTHYVAGYIMPDGVAFINGRSYSVSTSQHTGDVRGAIADRRRVVLSDLTEVAGDWKLLPRLAQFLEAVERRGVTASERAEMKTNVRKALVQFAEMLDSPILPAGDWGHGEWINGYTDESTGEYVGGRYADRDTSGDVAAGAYLAALVGLPAASWDKAKREAARAKAKRERESSLADRRDAERKALRYADVTAAEWRAYIARLGTEYSNHGLVSLGKELKRARSLMLHAKAGKLASAKRLATIRERIKTTAAAVATFDKERERRLSAKSLGEAIRTIRAFAENGSERVTWNSLTGLRTAALNLSRLGRTSAAKAAGEWIAEAAEAAKPANMAETTRRQAIERENAAKELEERKRLWLAGARVGSIRFDAETGGAALRIMGDSLETSHGADVPLAHAIKAFRFIKLCRERGESFHRNGRTIRVGHFQVDSIEPNGDFVAGCHRFSWPEVERVARLAGVFDQSADDSAVVPSSVAA